MNQVTRQKWTGKPYKKTKDIHKSIREYFKNNTNSKNTSLS